MSSDGSEALIRSEGQLTSDDTNTFNDVYLWTASNG